MWRSIELGPSRGQACAWLTEASSSMPCWWDGEAKLGARSQHPHTSHCRLQPPAARGSNAVQCSQVGRDACSARPLPGGSAIPGRLPMVHHGMWVATSGSDSGCSPALPAPPAGLGARWIVIPLRDNKQGGSAPPPPHQGQGVAHTPDFRQAEVKRSPGSRLEEVAVGIFAGGCCQPGTAPSGMTTTC